MSGQYLTHTIPANHSTESSFLAEDAELSHDNTDAGTVYATTRSF